MMHGTSGKKWMEGSCYAKGYDVYMVGFISVLFFFSFFDAIYHTN